MSAKRYLSVTVLAAALAAASGAAAAHDATPATRADMKAQVLQARARGELQPAGEAAHRFDAGWATASTLTRRQVRDDVLVARALGQLVPAGQGVGQTIPAGSQLARADVRDGVRMANLNGELARAGEAPSATGGATRAHLNRAEVVAMRTRR